MLQEKFRTETPPEVTSWAPDAVVDSVMYNLTWVAAPHQVLQGPGGYSPTWENLTYWMTQGAAKVSMYSPSTGERRDFRFDREAGEGAIDFSEVSQ